MRRLYFAPIGLILLALLWLARTPEDEVGVDRGVGGSLDAGWLDAGLGDANLEASTEPEPLAGVRRRAREEVAALRAAIEAARDARVREASAELAGAPGSRVGATPPSVHVPPEEDTERLGRLDPTYIRTAIRDLQPLLRECYDLTRESAARAGEAAPQGRLVARFVIGGEPGLGGVVEESEVMSESELRHPLLEECLTQTLYTVELPAPEEGGRVTVHYPFVFRSAEEPREE
ncbi:MAG: AgmX/PglI C-terminal domain-containing protein [Myxococcales bacterium]|nr:AgmX/PglI C-terminal domain-containing protein [Myxococcales bacterium]